MMIQLKPCDYGKVLQPLSSIKINHLFARSVLDAKVDGLVYADSASHPRVFYVAHPYGMSLVFGDPIALKHWTAFTQAARDGATRHEVLEAVEVAMEMAGGPATASARFALEVMDEVYSTGGDKRQQVT